MSCFQRFIELNQLDFDGDVVSIDGKTMRGTDVGRQDAVHVIIAWSNDHGITLAALESKGKKNEIKTIPDVIDLLNIEGVTITTDAMGCQRKIASKIIDSKNDYVLQVKGNQKGLLEEIQTTYQWLASRDFLGVNHGTCETVEKSHGRIEVRRYTQFELPSWFEHQEGWSKLVSVIRVERTREIRGVQSTEVSWYISSLSLNVNKAAVAVRRYWGVENGLHWRLDVIFDDDSCGIHSGFGAINFSIIKRFCMNLFTKDEAKMPLRRKVMLATINDDYRQTDIERPTKSLF